MMAFLCFRHQGHSISLWILDNIIFELNRIIILTYGFASCMHIIGLKYNYLLFHHGPILPPASFPIQSPDSLICTSPGSPADLLHVVSFSHLTCSRLLFSLNLWSLRLDLTYPISLSFLTLPTVLPTTWFCAHLVLFDPSNRLYSALFLLSYPLPFLPENVAELFLFFFLNKSFFMNIYHT